VDTPDPRYVKTADGAYIAYQVVGDGPIDIAWDFADFGNIDTEWEGPWTPWYRGLASFSRLILHDRRSTGLSSRNVAAPNLETRMADLRAVLDAAGSERPVIGGWLEGLCPGVLLAATDPDRVRALIWSSPTPRTIWAPDYPWGWKPDVVEDELRALEYWGTYEYGRNWAEQLTAQTGIVPSEEQVRFMARSTRNTCTPDVALELTKIWWETDIRSVLPSVQAPTLLITEGRGYTAGLAEYIASLMPRAEVETIPSYWEHGDPAHRDSIRRFVGIEPEPMGLDRVLSTVLFTDIVGSTSKAAELGDGRWKELLSRHDEMAKRAIEQYRGRYVNTTGDGLIATFDGPARAVRCAHAMVETVRPLGLEIRAGCHTGECELVGDDVRGLAVHIGSRVASMAGASEVWTSSTVKDLVAGSGLMFEDVGEHELKGVPDRWHLYRVVG
jgi:class 3 adenylate cyclase/pimeloyl-ACP methyl ester carboxylesterase